MSHWPIGFRFEIWIWVSSGVITICIQWVCEYKSNSWILYSLLHRAEETQQGRNSCPRLQFGFQFGLYRVVAPLSFLRSISFASLSTTATSLSIFGWSDLLQILRRQAAFSFAVLCIISTSLLYIFQQTLIGLYIIRFSIALIRLQSSPSAFKSYCIISKPSLLHREPSHPLKIWIKDQNTVYRACFVFCGGHFEF